MKNNNKFHDHSPSPPCNSCNTLNMENLVNNSNKRKLINLNNTLVCRFKCNNLFQSFSTLLLLLYLNDSCMGLPVNSNGGAMMYLSQYGWIDKSSIKPGSAQLVDIRGAIKEFQSFAGLNQTGDLDEETVKLMSLPRCGVKDKIGHDAKRRKRYVLQGSRWRVRDLKYKISRYPASLVKSEVDKEIDEAFKVWERETNLTFSKANSDYEKVHIEIQFVKGEHGDGDAFDGEGGTLAHAYFPVYGGDSHFDLDEKWTIRSYRGTNLFQVAAHEFGHSLGLSHSDVRNALMAPFYRGYQPNFKLDQDDVTAIQSLYGKKQQIPTYPKKRPSSDGNKYSPGDKTKICSDPKLDAITTMGDGNTYVFKGLDYYKLTDVGVAPGFPRRIRDDFPGLKPFLDSAFTWTNDKTYFFKGNQYWRVSSTELGFQMDDGYPKDISDGFEGIPSNIDAAFVWGGNGKIYFFKDDQYYRFDPSRRPAVASGYPKSISNWEGLPNNMDAALKYINGWTYFFKGNQYYRFNDRNFAVDKTSPPFPRPLATWWLGCGGDQNTSAMKSDADSDEYNPSVPNAFADSSEAGIRSGSKSNLLLTSLPHWNLTLILCFGIIKYYSVIFCDILN